MKTFLIVLFCLFYQISCEYVQISNINIEWRNKGTQTDFVISSPLSNGLSLNNAWLGFGFASQMVRIYTFYLVKKNRILINLKIKESS